MKLKATLTTLLVVVTLAIVYGQTGVSPSSSVESDAALKQQLAALQAKVKQLEAALASQSHTTSGMPGAGTSAGGGMQMAGMSTGGGMRMGGRMGEMNPMAGMQASGMNMPGSQSSGGMGMMEMMGDMSMMDQMMGGTTAGGGMTMESGMMNMAPQSALPGFPGASHVYHIGATGFFLDHAQHINLSTEQQVGLNKIKEQTLLAKSATDREIEQTEQELAILTSSDQPDLKKIDNKIREIAKLGADERVAFIKAVGEAAKLLTDQQRKILTGFASPAPAASPAASMSPMEHM
jgi:Spy/CpxP family protein refolding chaperone